MRHQLPEHLRESRGAGHVSGGSEARYVDVVRPFGERAGNDVRRVRAVGGYEVVARIVIGIQRDAA